MTDLGDSVYTPILLSAAVFDQYMQLEIGLGFRNRVRVRVRVSAIVQTKWLMESSDNHNSMSGY